MLAASLAVAATSWIGCGRIDYAPRPCATLAAAAPETPDLVLVVDRSASMDDVLDDGVRRWDAVRDAVLDPERGVLARVAGRARVGLVTYSFDHRSRGPCPTLGIVLPGDDNAAAIGARFDDEQPLGGTPTAETVDALLAELSSTRRASPALRSTVLVLITDGDPDTCEDTSDVEGGRAATLDALGRARSAGLRTVVIRLGGGGERESLDALARAGGGEEAQPFVVGDSRALGAALERIVTAPASCSIALEGRVDPASQCASDVILGGQALTCGDDFRVDDEGARFELLDRACARFRRGDAIEATFHCSE